MTTAFFTKVLGGATFLSSFTTYQEGEGPPWDFKNTYVKMHSECTRSIDDLLSDSDHGVVVHKIKSSGGLSTPNLGTSYFYLNPKNKRSYFPYKYIYLIKKKESGQSSGSNSNSDSSNETYYYIACFGRYTRDVFIEFEKRIFCTNDLRVKGIHIDSSGFENKFILTSRKAGEKKNNQKAAIGFIRDHFLKSKDKNTKVIISGSKGIGKTYTGGLLKKEIEMYFPGFANECFVLLYYDFDPTTPGLDIETLILPKASKRSPVILVINEIDDSYKEVFKDSNYLDNRTAMTQSRNKFHEMLDAIGDAEYVITIFTTEKSKEDLDAVRVTDENTGEEQNFHSFYRKGRVDFFINMTEDTATQVYN